MAIFLLQKAMLLLTAKPLNKHLFYSFKLNKRTDFFYNRIAFFYPLVDVWLKPQKRVLFREVNQQPQGHLLEVGVGNGSHLHQYKTHKIVGVDTALSMLKKAGKQKGHQAELLHMNGEALLFADASFDYVVLSHVVAVVADPQKLVEEVYRVLKPTGKVFILNHFTPTSWLKYVDRSFKLAAKQFHFKSEFYVSDIKALEKFSLVRQINIGPLSYFKLLIYQKA